MEFGWSPEQITLSTIAQNGHVRAAEGAFAAEVVAVVIGLIAGVLPAMRAAGMDPVDALRAE